MNKKKYKRRSQKKNEIDDEKAKKKKYKRFVLGSLKKNSQVSKAKKTNNI